MLPEKWAGSRSGSPELPRARGGIRAAQREPFVLAKAVHVDLPRREAQETIGLREDGRRGVPGEREPVGDPAPLEAEEADGCTGADEAVLCVSLDADRPSRHHNACGSRDVAGSS